MMIRPFLAFARVRAITAPFNAGETTEVKFALVSCSNAAEGELYLRVPTRHAGAYNIGDEFSMLVEPVRK